MGNISEILRCVSKMFLFLSKRQTYELLIPTTNLNYSPNIFLTYKLKVEKK